MLIDLGLAGACCVTVVINARNDPALSYALRPGCWWHGGAARGHCSVCVAIDQRMPAVHPLQRIGMRIAAHAVKPACCVVQWNACGITVVNGALLALRRGCAAGRVRGHHVGSSLVQWSMHRR
ncbi:hypothetical protein QY702_07770 [Xanthomonas campestris pv. plantaginis]|uniref:hypothetical protein n=1 Tax=Xanthomonas campestris TaxID=339 RepID=UPI002B23D760|nr:hypothetical protein [Xanthomonas campestris]MEA9606349.1 hypothetical protein [Xanthomonas campestris pv. plantaginis]